MVSRVLETRELLGPDEYLQSYLYLAAKWGSRFSAETLLKEGVSPNIDFDMSPLSIACLYGWTEIVQLLIEHHADVSASITTYSPLILACEAGNPNMVRLLLDAGADTDVQDVDGAGQMPQRRDTSDTRHANGSLENEASLETDIRIFGSPQSTTRTRVFSSEDFESMHGVEDINAAMVSFNPAQNSPIPPTPHPRPHGQTPLHIASYFGFTEIVQLLLEKGADANIRDRSDNRPLDVARQFERGDIVTILELHDILPMR
ncbi:ankyrin repeat-containing domain protein [Flagelloscypha sp. PMI_526]|nr:ankyrin repeat-containing domain protein [Flagelloscypha sp. PMI_526]